MNFKIKQGALWILVVVLASCSKGDAYVLGPQSFSDVEVIVEIRPGAPQVGMNEFLVVATHENRRPAYEYIVSIKMQQHNRWSQSIQDGATGVYRRAIRISNPDTDILQVQLQHKKNKDKVHQLFFPLRQSN